LAASSEITVRGLRELENLAASTSRHATKVVRASFRKVAEPIRSDAQGLAEASIPRIGPKWGKMRVGVTRTLVYVAPKERGVKVRGPDPRRRPKFADLMEARAMAPALERNEGNIEAAVEHALDDIAREWNRR
jgi:hypothetical protein